jgi:predicted TPR repeat methyltransferase
VHVLNAACQPEALLNRVDALIKSGHAGAARSLLAAARRLAPSSPRHAELAARLAISAGHLDTARLELDAAIADAPTNTNLRKLRAEVRRKLDDCTGAAEDAAEAVVLAPRDPVAKALLGVLMLDLQRTGDAVACLREAVAASPANPAFHEALAAAYDTAGDPDAALATLAIGIAAAPAHVGLRNAAVLLCVRHRDFVKAVCLAEDARVAGVIDACLFGLKGHALSSLGRHDEASEAYAEALKLGPEDPYVRHLAASAGIVPGAPRAPIEYLRTVFNGYADRFEAHLLSLGYRVPGLMRATLLAHGIAEGPILDLGCGTGLLAVVLTDLTDGPFVGVDVSNEMLAHASAKQLYAELHQADVVDFLRDDARSWPLVLAADVLCYFGALEKLFALVHARLSAGGRFVFTIELLQPDSRSVTHGNSEWVLGRLGRYVHAKHYVIGKASAAGFIVRRTTPEVLRSEANAPVAGLVVELERGDAY